MITLHLIQLVVNIVDYLFTHALNPIYVLLMDAGTYISGLQVPAILYEVISISMYFVPYGTILLLFQITIGLVGIAIILSFINVLMSFVKKLPFL